MNYQDDDLRKLIENPDIKLVLDSIFDGVYIVNSKKKIVFWNKGAENMTGFSAEEVMGNYCYNNILNHIDENGMGMCTGSCMITEVMKTGKFAEGKIFPMRKDKSRFPAWTKVGPLRNAQGEILGAIEIFRDISNEEDYKTLLVKFNTLVKKFISTTAYEEILNKIENIPSENNALKECTVMFIDIAGFTLFSKIHPPHEVIILLNEVFEICEKSIVRNHGDVDKFIGDAVMSTFDDANDAVAAALSILKKMEEYNAGRLKNGKEPVLLHYGINSGRVIHGEIGSSTRKDHTVIGNAVNIAAKLEAHSEPQKIYITGATYARLKNPLIFKYLNEIELPGISDKISVYVYP